MKHIEYETKDRIGYITMNRPDKRNALNNEMVAELIEAFDMAENDGDCKIVILRARGKVFCAGADLSYIQDLQNYSYEENLEDSNHLKSLFRKIYTLKKVVIAQIQGHAIAGGCGLATLCDFSISVPDAMFGYTEVRIGFIPAIVMVFLVRKVGEAHAKEFLLTGDLHDAKETRKFGLINRVVPTSKLEKSVYEFAQNLIRLNSEQSMAITKEMIGKVQSMDLDEGLDYAAEMNALARQNEDCRKGISMFLNKEPLVWD